MNNIDPQKLHQLLEKAKKNNKEASSYTLQRQKYTTLERLAHDAVYHKQAIYFLYALIIASCIAGWSLYLHLDNRIMLLNQNISNTNNRVDNLILTNSSTKTECPPLPVIINNIPEIKDNHATDKEIKNTTTKKK